MNFFRDDTSRIMQLGLAYDVSGVPGAQLEPAEVAEVLRRYPRLEFKRAFLNGLQSELERKQPYAHCFHVCTRMAHNQSPLSIVDAPAILDRAPFSE